MSGALRIGDNEVGEESVWCRPLEEEDAVDVDDEVEAAEEEADDDEDDDEEEVVEAEEDEWERACTRGG